jgi:hypothetical protein
MGRAARAAETEAIFRDVNEMVVEDQPAGAPEAEVVVLCECSNDSCAESLRVTRSEYERVRSEATHFLVAPDHIAPDIEIIVERQRGHWVIEKIAKAGEIAEEEDPRS